MPVINTVLYVNVQISYLFRITLHATTTTLFQPLKESSEQQVVFLGDDKPVSIKRLPSSHQKRTGINKAHSNSVEEGDDRGQREQQQQHLKRGQRGKLKKIKEKYKYQDEEERKLRMEILQVLSLYVMVIAFPIDNSQNDLQNGDLASLSGCTNNCTLSCRLVSVLCVLSFVYFFRKGFLHYTYYSFETVVS
jgi:hypothetical protein